MPVTIAGTTGITQPTDTCTTSLVLNGSTGSTSLVASSTASGTITLPAGTGTVAVNGVSSNIVSGTVTVSTSGTAATYNNIPSWVKRITFMFNTFSTSGSSNYIIQLGTGTSGSPTWTTSGYQGSANGIASTNASGIIIVNSPTAVGSVSGLATICLLDPTNNIWAAAGNICDSNSASGAAVTYNLSGWSVPLSGTLTQVRLTTVNGTDTFDAGKVNIMYE